MFKEEFPNHGTAEEFKELVNSWNLGIKLRRSTFKVMGVGLTKGQHDALTKLATMYKAGFKTGSQG